VPCVAQEPPVREEQEPVKVYTEGRWRWLSGFRADVRARRMGLQLFTLRSVVTAPRRETGDER
jgi:hypothetical protein